MALENFRGLKKSFWDDRKMLQVENFREGIFTRPSGYVIN
jgi:hypothetical protein